LESLDSKPFAYLISKGSFCNTIKGEEMYTASDLRKGLKIEIDQTPYVIVDFEFVKPGKGQALYKCKLKNLFTGALIDRTYRSGDTVQPAQIEERKMQYLYNTGDEYFFMDQETYEQIGVPKESLGDAVNFLIEGIVVDLLLHNQKPIGATLPNFVDLKVVKAEPWVKGDSVASDSKPVTLETGYQIKVPPFVQEGDIITVDTRTGQYVTRAK
jgi:elongation factor P